MHRASQTSRKHKIEDTKCSNDESTIQFSHTDVHSYTNYRPGKTIQNTVIDNSPPPNPDVKHFQKLLIAKQSVFSDDLKMNDITKQGQEMN